MGIRTPAVLMVGGCAAIALSLWNQRGQEIVARAITEAPISLLRSTQLATVGRVLVAVGDNVEQGQPLAVLEAPELVWQRKEIEARIGYAARGAEVARLELIRGLKQEERERALAVIEAQRDLSLVSAERQRRTVEANVAGDLRNEASKLNEAGLIDPYRAREQAALYADRESQMAEAAARSQSETRRMAALRKELAALGVSEELVAATEKLHAAELDVLLREREDVDGRLESLTVRSPRSGRVSELASPGSVLQPGDLVARVAPHVAEQVAMYASLSAGPPSTVKEKVPFTVTLADGRTCSGEDRVSVTSEAILKPPGLAGFIGIDSMGFPVRVNVPEHCQLPIGQLVELRLETR